MLKSERAINIGPTMAKKTTPPAEPAERRDTRINRRVPATWMADAEARAQREYKLPFWKVLLRFIFHYGQGEFPPEGYTIPPVPGEGQNHPGQGRPRKKKTPPPE